MIPLLFNEVRVTEVADTPVLLLHEQDGPRELAVWITAAGGNAILSALEGGDDEHPNTHDLMIEALAVLDAVVEQVTITGVVEGVYDAQVVIAGSVVNARVSDAVALALRCGAPILADEALLDAVGVVPRDAGSGTEEGDDQMEQFRAFLDNINPEDFGPGADQP